MRTKKTRGRRRRGQKGGFLSALLRDLQRIPQKDRNQIPRDLKRIAKGLVPPKGKEGLVPFSPLIFGSLLR